MLNFGVRLISASYDLTVARGNGMAAGVCGFFLVAGVSGVYGIIATACVPHLRASGAGLIMGIWTAYVVAIFADQNLIVFVAGLIATGITACMATLALLLPEELATVTVTLPLVEEVGACTVSCVGLTSSR